MHTHTANENKCIRPSYTRIEACDGRVECCPWRDGMYNAQQDRQTDRHTMHYAYSYRHVTSGGQKGSWWTTLIAGQKLNSNTFQESHNDEKISNLLANKAWYYVILCNNGLLLWTSQWFAVNIFFGTEFGHLESGPLRAFKHTHLQANVICMLYRPVTMQNICGDISHYFA